MEQSRSYKPPLLLCNPNVSLPRSKNPSLELTLNQSEKVYKLRTYVLKIHFNITLPFEPRESHE
jgi:hypothetical protein